MSKKEFTVRTKYGIGDEVWIVKEADYNEKMPFVFVGNVTRISVPVLADNEQMDRILPMLVKYSLTFTAPNQRAYHLKDDYYEIELMSEKQAKEVFSTYIAATKHFKDDYIKTILAKAKKFVEVYGK